MSIYVTNARSIKNKYDELCLYINKNPHDIIVVSESWLDDSYPSSMFNIDGYRLYRADRSCDGGGVAVWSRFPANEITCPTNKLISNILVLRFSDSNTVLIAIYHPYWGKVPQHQCILGDLQSLIDLRLLPTDKVIIAGDINDLRLYCSNFLLSNNLIQLVDFPTRGQNTLDIVCIPFDLCHLYQSPVKVCPLGKSDHSGISLKPKIEQQIVKRKVKIHDYSSKNRALFMETMNTIDWNTILPHYGSVNEIAQVFDNTLSNVFSTCFPLKCVSISSRDPPWVTSQTKLLMRKKDKAYHSKNKSRYMALRDELNKQIQHNKLNLFKNISTLSGKELWCKINTIIKGRTHTSTLCETSVNALNQKFSKVFEPADALTMENFMTSTYVKPAAIHALDIMPIIKKIKSNAPGCDGLPGFIFKQNAEALAYPLAVIMNASLKQGFFPSNWKKANIVPIPKGKDDFRPISLLPVASKIIEKTFLQHILFPFLCNKFDPYQFGFVPSKYTGTSRATLNIHLQTLNNLTNDGGYVRCLAVDFLKAFDKASHKKILQHCAEDFNVPVNILKWIQSFLTGRQQRVISQDHAADWVSCTSGVPQGSILGPILFCTLVNNFATIHPRS